MRLTLKAFAVAALAALGATGASAQSSEHPVVVELFTSQGCSSCPPADKLLKELSARDDVIALALHVDYWDYIGWKDVFADPRFSARQKAYAVAGGRRSVYTPQMIIDGSDHVVGTHPMDVADLIGAHAERARPVQLNLSRNSNGDLRIEAHATTAARTDFVVQLVRYLPEKTVEITRGENTGKRLTYSNIVDEWEQLAEWDGHTPLTLSVPAPGNHPAVVLIQRKGPGPIEAAAILR
ncbi:DUF1223 domain-containing protein [Lutimaribacter sp. EGI FJ00015]|uniref:DUF1223 domain-containing protein n=1 Tax=Lutimaribacter degradans TaxID=2945989 RepID=A0ACC5ZRU1_9RHOB|nr:DUF1223 domain-containing protein [Lutimaribacter sp. EGI FJ00013]MCM2560987.1 DUF1223 domain-containing protein [Lutimaribacter sp. EGI FJ00013]MCO0612066.1 DUF1223 domain-containing protein [Lutimaribacter sp. EGI FJ00015]MCO0634814.1 DUF1223 domain-containing protein [Lutimaribacter sp. EGI FJ00014]